MQAEILLLKMIKKTREVKEKKLESTFSIGIKKNENRYN